MCTIMQEWDTILVKIHWKLVLIRFPQEIEKINLVSSMIHILFDNKALEHDKLIIMTSEVGSRTFSIACEGNK